MRGLAESFALASRLVIDERDSLALLLPTPAAFVVLKLLSFGDRRAPSDLRDLGYVVRHAPTDEAAAWDDPGVIEGFASGDLTWDDLNAWQIGRAIEASFKLDTRVAFRAALERLSDESEYLRAELVREDGRDLFDPDKRLASADRMIEILQRACRR